MSDSNQIQAAEEVVVETITIDGNDVQGLFLSVDVFENIFTPIITGQIQLMETDGSAFIEKYEIEGNEPIQIKARGVGDKEFEFDGVLNGLRNKAENQQMTIYTFDFTSKEMRKNEEARITKSFKDTAPEEIVKEKM